MKSTGDNVTQQHAQSQENPGAVGIRSFEAEWQAGIGANDIATALRLHKLPIAALVAAALLVSAAIVVLSNPIYKAEALLAPATASPQQGLMEAIGPLSGLAQVAGVNLASSDSTWVNLATIESRAFIEPFIEKLNLMPTLFSDDWDAENNDWQLDVKEDPPTMWDAYTVFDEEVLDVSWDTTTQLISVTIYWDDPQVAAEWVNGIVDGVNEDLRQRAIVEAENSIAFLNEELQKTSAVGLRQAIYDLIESQISNIMLANVRDDYAFRIIDPAVPPDPDDYIWPKPILTIAIGAFVGLALGFGYALLRMTLSRSAG